jgi:hypothetical protein
MNPFKTFSIFIAIGISLLLMLLIWIALSLRTRDVVLLPEPLPLGNAFEGNEQIPIEEFKSQYQSGIDQLNSHKASAIRYKKIHNVLDWLGFGLTSVLTLLVGYLGKVTPNPNDSIALTGEVLKERSAENASKKRKRKSKSGFFKLTITYLGVLAALASISIALSNRLQAQVEKNVSGAMELNSALSKARAGWFNAKTPEDAQQVLSQLESDLLKGL